MILGGTLASEARMPEEQALSFVLFPLVVHALDIVVSSVGITFVTVESVVGQVDPMTPLKRGYQIALMLSVPLFTIACAWMVRHRERGRGGNSTSPNPPTPRPPPRAL